MIDFKYQSLFCTTAMSISKRKNEPSHYMLKIESFSLLSEATTTKIESDVFEASSHKWRLDLYPNGNREEKSGNHISLYLIICDTETLPKGWEVYVDVHFFIYDHIRHDYATFQDIMNGNRRRFHEKKMKWGFHKLISLNSFKKSENGYLENDSCVFGAEVFAVTEYAQKDRCLSMIKPPSAVNTHTWKIDNYSNVTETVLHSQVFKVGKLLVYPEGDGIGVGERLSFYLGIHKAALPDGWRVYAKCKLRVKDQSDNNDKEKGLAHWFCDSVPSWGYTSFMLLSELNDPEKGYLLNGSLIVEAEFSLVGMRLRVYPDGNGVTAAAGTNLSFYLEVHDAASLPDGWRVYANFVLRLKNQTDYDDKEKETEKWFNSLATDWGFACFMPLKQLHDPANGFLLNGSVTLEVDILLVGMFRNFI
ncbi:hypothetical protein OSB04_016167 [Centaurea solstitialis]|uniref:MATH domain-containing protein n=1 Tax=Centaurea solstitialis TaxID=347529 RepID=A0AA38W9K0_9ASTR|nr:hypothetical protein OSB04_016167 [Centaurea solstitialis]